MNNTTNTLPNFSTGRLCVPVDDDIAVQEEQTVLCSEAYSINSMNPPNELLTMGLNNSILSATLTNDRRTAYNLNPQGESSGQDNRQEQDNDNEEIEKKRKEIWNGIGKKHGIKIATLNLKGRNDKDKKSKWPMIATLMRKERIAILAVQETHLDNTELNKLEITCPKIEIISNSEYTNKEGVGFVLNKDIVNGMEWEHDILLENRASKLTIKVEENRKVEIIVLYAPNNNTAKRDFFKELQIKLTNLNSIENTIILGDFNMVENQLDRFPHRPDDINIVKEWLKIRRKHNLIDGWREQHPEETAYTYTQPITLSMSRIDRIYLSKNLYPYAYEWRNNDSATISDHNIITVEILKKDLPFVGNGSWRMYDDDIEDAKILKLTMKKLTESHKKMINLKNNNEQGIQQEWLNLKTKIREITKKTNKDKAYDRQKEKTKLRNKVKKTIEKLENATIEKQAKHKENLRQAKENLTKRTRNDLRKLQDAKKARYRVKGEKCTKYWFNLNNKRIDDQTILALKNEHGQIKNKTQDMMDIAKKYHQNLQKRPEMTNEREEAITEMEEVTDKKLDKNDCDYLSKETTREEIKNALKQSKNGTSPGLDGIPYEYYKKIKEIKEKKPEDKEIPDIIEILLLVFNDIENRGIIKEGEDSNEFTDGLMYLLYKKKEKYKIENYRPLALLNTDYKLYTKSIASKLATVSHKVLNEDQAGFVPKRSIYDHTKNTQTIIEYCNLTGKNGCIVALDQEKAYDKIDHDYLWRILKKNGFPEVFITRIKELYKDTNKSIMVNGVKTEQFKVQRGVHQGDPMSCLLYNIAIEPLAELIRRSKLKGISTKAGIRLLVELFADDTLVYVDETDDLRILDNIIERFCIASTAKFNITKTEYLPVGNTIFRNKVINDKKIGNYNIPEGTRLVKDGESMRTLGSWVGNEKSDELQWENIVSKQEKVLDTWSKMNLTYRGKELILKTLVQSKAIYLATVNGMPKVIVEKLKSMYKAFIWDGKKALMDWQQIIAPISEGGLGMPDIRSRYEAIEIMWIKRWLTPNKKKPKWTQILDEIISNNITKSPMIDENSRISWILQSWNESEAKDAKLSPSIRYMLKVARKFNITATAPKYSEETKRELPLWHNQQMTEANYQWNKKASRCLRENHEIRTIGDLIDQEDISDCDRACQLMKERLVRMIPPIINPIEQTPQKIRESNLDLTPKRIKKNKENKVKKIFNPDITARGNPLEQVRIFAEKLGPKTRQNITKPQQPAYRKEIATKKGNTTAKIIEVTMNKGKVNEVTKICIIMTGATEKKIEFEAQRTQQTQDCTQAIIILYIMNTDKSNNIKIKTKNKQMVKWIGEKINEEENNAWLKTKEKEIWKMVLTKLRRRDTKIKIELVAEESKIGKEMNKIKMELKNKALQSIEIVRKSGSRFVHDGAILMTMTQKKAYDLALQRNKKEPGGIVTKKNIEKIIREAKEKENKLITKENIWTATRKLEQPQITQFIWKMIHGRIKCGTFFRHIPQWREKEYCRCGETESIEHILTECKENGQEDVWKLLKTIWKDETDQILENITISTIMRVGTLETKKLENKKEADRLLRTLIATAAWAIWKTRNDRIFNEVLETPRIQVNNWLNVLSSEIKIEINGIQVHKRNDRTKEIEKIMNKWTRGSKLVEKKGTTELSVRTIINRYRISQ